MVLMAVPPNLVEKRAQEQDVKSPSMALFHLSSGTLYNV